MTRRPAPTLKSNVAGAVLPLGVLLLAVPLHIHHIGAERFGVPAVVWTLLGCLDFGLFRAAAPILAAFALSRLLPDQDV